MPTKYTQYISLKVYKHAIQMCSVTDPVLWCIVLRLQGQLEK